MAFLLTACAGSTPSVDAPINLPALPAKSSSWTPPVTLPSGLKPMAQVDVERYWSRDRAALLACGRNLDNTVLFYEDLASSLRRPSK